MGHRAILKYAGRGGGCFEMTRTSTTVSPARSQVRCSEGMADGFRVGTRSPMIAGGNSIPEMVAAEHPTIWKQSGNFGPPRVHLPKLNPKYPETKHT
eukprot:6648131-Prymnesium_polylepis.1